MIKACVLLADGFEEIEALTAVDLLRRAQVFVETVSIMEDYNVHGSHGITVQADDLFGEVDFSDVNAVVLPGGMPGTTNLKEHEGVRKLVTEFAEHGKLIGAICAAPTVLSDLELLKGKKATSFPAMEPEVKCAAYLKDPVVTDGNIVTSRGVGTAIEFALELIRILTDEKRADSIAESIVYARGTKKPDGLAETDGYDEEAEEPDCLAE